ncbi:MAG: VWA domain-containing protein [Acidimicrobiia bacterium]
MNRQRRRTTSRRDLAKHKQFDEVSPEVGILDEAGFDRALSEDRDEALTLLADLTGATDRALAQLARRLAGRLTLELTRTGPAVGRGVRRLRSAPADRAEGDLDLDASLEALLDARRSGRRAAADELRVRTWARPEVALCLVVDRSGSMGGERLAAAALAAAACSWRCGDDYSVLAFSDTILMMKGQDERRRPPEVVDDLLSLRGFGPTDLSLALRVAAGQLSLARASRRVAVLLSDCRPTAGADPALAAGALDELAIIAPDDDADDAEELAARVGARCVRLHGPGGIPAAFLQVMEAR